MQTQRLAIAQAVSGHCRKKLPMGTQAQTTQHGHTHVEAHTPVSGCRGSKILHSKRAEMDQGVQLLPMNSISMHMLRSQAAEPISQALASMAQWAS